MVVMHDVTQMPHRCTPCFYGPDFVDDANLWCGANCSSAWTMGNFYPGYGATPPTWYFMSREDWLAFMLRWMP